MRRVGIVVALIAALGLFPGQQTLPGFPPGVFFNRGAIDAPIVATSLTMPVLAYAAAGGSVTNTAQNYMSFMGGTISGIGAATTHQAPIAVAGVLSNLSVSFPQGVGAGSWSVALNLGGTNSSTLFCNITSGTTCTCSPCSVNVSAGNLVEWATCPGTYSGGTCTPSGTNPTATTTIQISAEFVSTGNNQAFLASSTSVACSTSVFNYLPLSGVATCDATDLQASSLIPAAGVLDQFYVYEATSPGAAKSYTFYLMHNGVESTVTCSISGTPATSCSDLIDSITVAAGDTVSVQICPGTVSGGVCTTNTPASSQMGFGVRWTPTTAGQAIVLWTDTAGTVLTTGTQYEPLTGGSQIVLTETNSFVIGNLSFHLSNLWFGITPVLTAGITRTVTMRAGTGSGQSSVGSPSNLSAQITSSTTAICGGSAVYCANDLTDSYGTSAGTFLNWQEVEVGASPPTVTSAKIGAVVSVP